MADAQGILQRVFDDGAQALRVLLGGTVSDDAPSSPVEGDFWYESDTGSFFVRVGGSWVEIAQGTPLHANLTDLATSGHPASAIAFTPDGSIAATNVQDAIVEVRDEAGSALAIGAAVGGQTDNTILFTDASGNLDDNVLTIEQSTLFGVADFTQLTAPVASAGGPGWVNATPLGAPYDVSGWFLDSFDLFAVADPSSLKTALVILNDTPGTILAAGHFGIGLGGSNAASLAGSAIYLDVTKSDGSTDVTFGTDIDVLDFSGNVLTDIGNGSASSDAAAYGQIIPKTLIDAKGDLIVGTAADTAARLAVGATNGHVLMVDSAETAGMKWASVSASPGGSDTYVQYNDGGAFGGEAAFAYNETTNRLTVTGGYRMAAGSSNFIGDSDGNGYLYFDGNAANLYGYTAVNLRDGSGQFASFTRARIALGPNSPSPSDWFGGDLDYGIKLSPESQSYLGTGFGSIFSPDVNATANNDYLVGTGFQTTFSLGAYTGTTLINAGFVNTKADEIGVWVKGFTSQSADLFRAVDRSNTTLMAIAKNGAIKPASLADASAENSTLYYSTDASKLVFKDSGGTVNALY